MKLYLVRHGDAVFDQVDSTRPLNEKGKADVLKVAMHLKEGVPHIESIFHSGKKRAEQTAEIIKNALYRMEV